MISENTNKFFILLLLFFLSCKKENSSFTEIKKNTINENLDIPSSGWVEIIDLSETLRECDTNNYASVYTVVFVESRDTLCVVSICKGYRHEVGTQLWFHKDSFNGDSFYINDDPKTNKQFINKKNIAFGELYFPDE